MKTPFELIADLRVFRDRYTKDAEGHEHSSENGQFVGSGGGGSGGHSESSEKKISQMRLTRTPAVKQRVNTIEQGVLSFVHDKTPTEAKKHIEEAKKKSTNRRYTNWKKSQPEKRSRKGTTRKIGDMPKRKPGDKLRRWNGQKI